MEGGCQYKFIKPQERKIGLGQFEQEPSKGVKTQILEKYLGFSFERFCRRYHHIIANILGFSAVHYRSGVYYSRATDKTNAGYQIDLVFERDDRVVTVCEIKYLKSTVSTSVIKEMEEKLKLFPMKKDYTLHKVLITTSGADNSLVRQAYFDNIIILDQLFDSRYW